MATSMIALLFALFGSSSALYDAATSNVVIFNETEFQNVVVQGDEYWTIEFFAPWCGHCKQIAPAYDKVAKDLKGIVNVGAVDCDAYKTMCQSIGVKGFPSIRFFLPEKQENPYTKKQHKVVQEYQGGRSAKDIAAAAVHNLPSKVIIVNETNSATFLEDDYPKALLFSQKSEVSGLYKSLSLKYKDRIRFGQTSEKTADLVKAFGVGSKKLPQLLIVTGEDSKNFVFHEGAINREEIPAFLDKYALETPLVDPTFSGRKKLIHTLTETTFSDSVLKDSEHPWLVLFSDKPVTGRALQNLASFAAFVDPAVRVGIVGPDSVKSVAKSQEVTKLPTLRLYQLDKSDTDEYLGASLQTGFPTEEELSKFLDDKVSSPVNKLFVGDSFNTFIQKCVEAPCIFLFTKDVDPPLMFKLPAISHQKKLSFGMLTDPPATVLQQFQVNSPLPAIMAFYSQDGTLASMGGYHHYGQVTYAEIERFCLGFDEKVKTQEKKPTAVTLQAISKDIPLETACTSIGLCAILFVDGSKTPEAVKEAVDKFDAVREKKAGSPYKFMWVDVFCQPEIGAAFDVQIENVPTVVVVSKSKMRQRQLFGAYDENSIGLFLDGVLSGKHTTAPFSQLPPYKDVDCNALREEHLKALESAPVETTDDDDVMAEVLAAAKAREEEEKKLRRKKSDDDDDDDEPKKKKKKKKKSKK